MTSSPSLSTHASARSNPIDYSKKALREIAILLDLKKPRNGEMRAYVTPYMVVNAVKELQSKYQKVASNRPSASDLASKRKREEEIAPRPTLSSNLLPFEYTSLPRKVISRIASQFQDVPLGMGVKRGDAFVKNGQRMVVVGYAHSRPSFNIVCVKEDALRIYRTFKGKDQHFYRTGFVAQQVGGMGELKRTRVAEFWSTFAGESRTLLLKSKDGAHEVKIADFLPESRKQSVLVERLNEQGSAQWVSFADLMEK
jgi:hypothetical protein